MSYYARGHSIVDENDNEFDEYDPTPFNGGYDISITYGHSLPPSEEICYPPSTSSSSYGAPDQVEEQQVDYNRPSYSSDAEPLAYREEASVNEYKSYHRQPQHHPYPPPPAPYGEPGYGPPGGGPPGYGFMPPPGPPPSYGGPPPPYPPGGYDGGEHGYGGPRYGGPGYGGPGYGGPGYGGPPGPYRGSGYGGEPGSEYRSDRDQPGYGEERRYGRKQHVSISVLTLL